MMRLVTMILFAALTFAQPAAAKHNGKSPYVPSFGHTSLIGTFPYNNGDSNGHLLLSEAWLGTKFDFILGFLSSDTWANFDAGAPLVVTYPNGAGGSTSPVPFGHRVIWAMPLTVGSGSTASTSLSSVASGSNDSDFIGVAQKIIASQPYGMIIIRLGWEMNGPYFPWYAYGNEANYIAAFQHVSSLIKAQPGGNRVQIVWNPNRTAYRPGVGTAIDPSTMYPGDAYVDVVGQDVYLQSIYDSAGAQAWSDAYSGETYGLLWMKNFAVAHNKPLAIPEWGIDTDSYSVNVPSFANYIATNNVYFHDYWDSNENINCLLSSGNALPNTAAAFIAAFNH